VEKNLQRMFQTQDMAGQRINGKSIEKLLLTQQKWTPWEVTAAPRDQKQSSTSRSEAKQHPVLGHDSAMVGQEHPTRTAFW
jgi:hypothetical protein